MKLPAFLMVAFIALNTNVLAQQGDIDAYINTSVTPTYDCPAEELDEQITSYLELDTLAENQRHALIAMQTHGQICNGNNATAEQTLLNLVDSSSIDKASRHYAAALYQLGFIYYVQSNPIRCDYYQQAKAVSEGIYLDVSLSATLGLITECESNADDGVRLGKLFTLLEQYSNVGEPGAIAQIHNTIGLFFGTLGQHVLAAEQYMKAHRLGLKVYTGSNQLSILISAITSYMASGNFDQAEEAIDEFRRLNINIDTPLTNFWLLFAEAGYFYRTGQFDQLRLSLAAWDEMKEQVNSTTYNNLFNWYAAVLCLADSDAQCLMAFLEAEQQTSDGYKAFVHSNKDYLKFITDVHFFLNDIEQAEQSYQLLATTLFDSIRADQASARILGIANLYAEINNLENSLAKSKQTRDRLVAAAAVILLLSFIFLAFYLRKRRLAQEEIDPVTQLLNNKTTLRQIEQIDSPSSGKTNALAIFDIGNFREVNRLVGSTKSDYVLQQIAHTLKDITRTTDILGRFAPEQFILCLPDIEEETAKKFFERIRQALEDTSLSGDTNRNISVRSSMSIFISGEKFGDINDVLDDMLRSLSIQS